MADQYMARDMRATVRELLVGECNLTYDQCVQLSEKIADFFVLMSDSDILIPQSNGAKEVYYSYAGEWNSKK
jgi:hypothetical protein